MKKIFVSIISGLLLVGVAGVFLKSQKKSENAVQYTIGILQTASHPALDAVRDGFIEELTAVMGNKVAFDVRNVQGSVAQAHSIAQQFHVHKQYDAFLAIATPAAQALSVVERERPIFIAAVTDPHALGMIHEATNVCGTSDMVDVKAAVEMIKQMAPVTKTVGLLYTSGETNSLVLVKQMHEELRKQGLIGVDVAVSNESDIAATASLACRKADVLWVPTDNTIASAISLVTRIALQHKKPLFVSDATLVSQGALASRGVDYRKSGKQTARIAHRVLVDHKKPYDVSIEHAGSEKIVANKETLKELGLIIPASLQSSVIFVTQEKQ